MAGPALTEPVRPIAPDRDAPAPSGTALCLSGGGYRAMVFHVGVLRRLYEAGWLVRLDRVSSVSGGSITAAVLGSAWASLDHGSRPDPAPFVEHVQDPVHRMASTSIDIMSVLTGLLLPFVSIGDRVADAYRRTLFGDRTLQDLPDSPTFVINATNLASGALFRFTKRYLADWRVGRVPNPTVDLATAVAASSAFPPFLSPHHLDLRDARWTTDRDNTLITAAYRGELDLSDGGVYDNLGIETAWKRCATVIVSDAGGRMNPDADPPDDWPRHTLRVLEVIDNQVRSLRKRHVIAGLRAGKENGGRDGFYVSSRSQVADFPVDGLVLPADTTVATALAETPTRLDALDRDVQERLVNWGYTITDAGLRAHLDPGQPAGNLPYPAHPLTAGSAAGRR